jgi:uncharacterized protein
MTATSVRSEPVSGVQFVRNVLIPLSDGVTLAADLHLPAAPGPHPTLISFYPYRKDDIIGSFAAYPRRWFAERGYVHLLVDVRGYGGSEGRHAESFDPRAEAADAGEVVEWAAAQDWSDGAVGVWGVSYGGLMALAAGAARPPHLRAIAPVYPLWDVYADVVARGGCRTMITQHQWSTIMLAQRLAPPSYRDPGGRWARVWRERLEQLEREPIDISAWREHPADDPFWRERVVALERIDVPTFLIGGWRDLFPESVVRAYGRIHAPKRLLIGPWLHVPPDVAEREPVDWLSLLHDFFEEHLRGAAPILDQASVLAFVQGDGGWRAAEDWPVSSVSWTVLRPGRHGSLGQAPEDSAAEYEPTALVGAEAGQWDAMGTGMGYPLDQGADDRASLRYERLVDRVWEVCGSPEAVLDVQRLDEHQPFLLVVKLVDVAPDGSGELITSGWAHTEGGPTSVRLWATAFRLAPGHRLRLSVSCADFPRTWPGSMPRRLRVSHASSELRLPLAREEIGTRAQPRRPAATSAAERFPWMRDGSPAWSIERDLANGALAVTLGGSETLAPPHGGTFAIRQSATARVTARRPDEASVRSEAAIDIESAEGERIEVRSRSRAWRDRDVFWGSVSVDGCVVFERSWRSAAASGCGSTVGYAGRSSAPNQEEGASG